MTAPVPALAHSPVGASAAHRWIACPGSVREEAKLPPEPSSPSAAQGTLRHSVGEWCLATKHNADEWQALGADGMPMRLDPEAAAGVQLYVDTVRSALAGMPGGPQLFVERRVSLAHLHPEAFGTLDAAVVQPFGRGKLFDYKDGAGVYVEVEDNAQLAFYAVALADEFDLTEVEATIVQPFAGGEPVRTSTLDAGLLASWKRRFVEAFLAVQQVDAPLNPSPKACQWCRAAATCPKLRKEAEGARGLATIDPAQMTREQLAKALDLVDLLELFCSKLRAHAFNAIAVDANAIPGWKLAPGRAGNRSYGNAEQALMVLDTWGRENGKDASKLLRTSIASPAEVEKAWGKSKAVQAILEAVTVRPPGKPRLVRASGTKDFDDAALPAPEPTA